MIRMIRLLAFTLILALASIAAASDYPSKVAGGIQFTYRDEGARNVAWAGDHNGWDSNANVLADQGDGVWTIVLQLGPGEHQYKFVVDGNWITDPSNPQTGGDYGNSVIKMDGKGELIMEGGGPQPSPLNSKLFVDGFYYSRTTAEALDSEDRRVQVEKPTHSLNLAFDVELNPSLAGRMELNADNIANPSDMWRTALNFQRARLVMTRPAFTLTLFENESVFRSDDALGIVGKVNTYAYDYGYGARGGLLSAALPYGFQLTALIADASVDSPFRPADPDRSVEDASADMQLNYNRTENAGFRDDWVMQLERRIGPGRALYLGHAVRGLTPGFVWVWENLGDEGLNVYQYRTVQNNLMHALSYRLERGEAFLEVEGLQGYSNIQANDLTWEWRGLEEFRADEQAERSWRIQESRGLALETESPLPWGFTLGGGHSFQEIRNILIESSEELSSRAMEYRGKISWTSKLADWSLEATQSEFHYDEGLGWGDQFVFAAGETGYGNPWIMGDRLPLDSYMSLGYASSSRLRQDLSLLLHEGAAGNMDLNLRHTIASTRLDREPFYWEFIAELDWRFHEEWSFLFNQRLAEYDQDFLQMKGGYGETFLELTYHLNRQSWLALSWGVDPYWLDPTSKTFLPHGRREFLADAGMNDTVLKESYLGLARIVKRAESELRDARIVTLEARFDF